MYYDRYEEATTSLALGDIKQNHIVLCHNNANQFNCISNYGELIETGEPTGIQNNFNYALKMLEPGEWGIFLSDDYIVSKKLQDDNFIECNIKYVLDQLINLLAKCDQAGINLLGLNSTGNPFYAKKKYGKYGLVDGRAFAIKKTGFVWHPDISTCTDYYATVYHLKKYGGNLIYNHAYMDFKRYEKKGLGTVLDRADKKIADIKILKKLYPDNVIIRDKKGQPKNSHIVIKR